MFFISTVIKTIFLLFIVIVVFVIVFCGSDVTVYHDKIKSFFQSQFQSKKKTILNASIDNANTNKVTTDKVHASLTTVPERIQSEWFHTVVTRILEHVECLYLNIPHQLKRTGEDYVIPPWILQHDNIIVTRCDDDGPITKIMGGLDIFDEKVPIVILDDDIIYKHTAIPQLVTEFQNNPNGVSCHYTFQDWKSSSELWFPGGFSGCIATKHTFQKLKPLLPMQTECFYIDDHWLGWAYDQLQIQLTRVPTSTHWRDSCETIKGHPEWFELQTDSRRTDQIPKCFKQLFAQE